LVKLCESQNLGALCRSPLAMGLLSAKYTAQNTAVTGKDIRTSNEEWLAWFKDGKPSPEFLKRREAVRDILCSGGRSLVQGSLAWLWGKSQVLIPIPGFKNAKQAPENAAAMEFGPLTAAQVAEVERLVDFTVKFTDV
jgi:aryl-alcohol dehydrogenase-like predicted oxidoreductase